MKLCNVFQLVIWLINQSSSKSITATNIRLSTEYVSTLDAAVKIQKKVENVQNRLIGLIEK